MMEDRARHALNARRLTLLAILAAAMVQVACSRREAPGTERTAPTAVPPSILLVTLDTTRADAMGPHTPNFNALAARGRRFTRAYTTAPQTLPSHCSLMTGLYPGGHGVHENARYLAGHHPVAAEKLRQAGYRTASFVSAFPLARRFGLARGFDTYDDALIDERSAAVTTDRALAHLQNAGGPIFLWVHYFEPHHPYSPPGKYRARYAGSPYRGEVAAMDEQLGRLIDGFDRLIAGSKAFIVVGDHGEGLGDHGEEQHGNLLYEGVMRVPLAIVGPGVPAGVSNDPVSIRRVFHTLLDWGGVDSSNSLRQASAEVVLGEAMKPFLQYGWQPQVMGVKGAQKAIYAGQLELYDVANDPGERRDLGGSGDIDRDLRKAVRDYPVPSPTEAAKTQVLDDESRRRLASLGYVSAGAAPVIRKDAPAPRRMTHVFPLLDEASARFALGEYAASIPLFRKILASDRHNVGIALQLAASFSALGRNSEALAAFREAERIAPASPDVRHYLALHYAKTGDWERASPLLEQVVADDPNRLPALEALAVLRERQQRFAEAVTLWRRIQTMKTLSAAELLHFGRAAMAAGDTPAAVAAFEQARNLDGDAFEHHLELGVLYLAMRRLEEAAESLDRVPRAHPGYPMALFKRAQVSVLLGEPDRAERIERARRAADASTRELIARENLFRQ